MKNFLQEGCAIDVVAPGGGLTGGQFYVVGSLFGVVAATVLVGETVALHREGVFTLPKVTGTAWTQGDALYWDAGTSKFTKVASGNRPLGIAAADAASGAATGSVSIEAIQESVGLMLAGEIALDGSNPTPVATGFTTITGVALTLKKNSAPGVGTQLVTYDTSGGTLNIYGWKPTATGDCTMIASTGTETVGYVVFGV